MKLRFLAIYNLVFEALLPETMKAWSAKSLLTLIAGLSILTTLSVASSGWQTILNGFLVSIIAGLIIWTMMSLVDGLQNWSKRTNRKFVGVLILLTSLGVFWFVIVSTMIWFTGKNT